MALGRPMPPLGFNDDHVQQLKALASSRSLRHSILQRAQIVLDRGAGETNTAIAKRMELTGMTVGKWRNCYQTSASRVCTTSSTPVVPAPTSMTQWPK